MTEKLGQVGERDAATNGEGPLPGKVRKPRRAEAVTERFKEAARVHDGKRRDGVQPLNVGFFMAQSVRADRLSAPKVRAARKALK